MKLKTEHKILAAIFFGGMFVWVHAAGLDYTFVFSGSIVLSVFFFTASLGAGTFFFTAGPKAEKVGR